MIEATPEELLEAVKALWPKEYEIALLNVVARKQQELIAELTSRLDDTPPVDLS